MKKKKRWYKEIGSLFLQSFLVIIVLIFIAGEPYASQQ